MINQAAAKLALLSMALVPWAGSIADDEGQPPLPVAGAAAPAVQAAPSAPQAASVAQASALAAQTTSTAAQASAPTAKTPASPAQDPVPATVPGQALPPRLTVLAPPPSRLTQAQTLTTIPAAGTLARPTAGNTVARAAASQSSTTDAPKFASEDKWLIAGYNNDEIIYQVFITNQDARIIRCITEIHGSYFDNGKKQSISDRQITTVFPNQPTQAGTWLDMDRESGASYSVKCHPL
jgi:hypothetical protein